MVFEEPNIQLPLPFDHVKLWVHEAWVGLQSVERMLDPLEVQGVTAIHDGQLRIARTTLIHCIEQAMIALNGLHEELVCRGDFGEGKK